jgi:hypothetical protein
MLTEFYLPAVCAVFMITRHCVPCDDINLLGATPLITLTEKQCRKRCAMSVSFFHTASTPSLSGTYVRVDFIMNKTNRVYCAPQQVETNRQVVGSIFSEQLVR